MRHYLQLAFATLLTATTAHAQFHMPQLSHKEKENREDVSWLAPFAVPEPAGRENDLIRDPRFKTFIRTHLTAPQSFWNDNQSLTDTILEFLAVPNEVVLQENRYLSISGCVQHFCPSRGLLFVDLGTAHPLIVFAAIDWVKENKTPSQSGAEYTLWVFTNRPLSTVEADTNHVPVGLKNAFARWTAQPASGSTTISNISHSILVDPDGTPHQVASATLGVATKSTPVIHSQATPNTQQPARD